MERLIALAILYGAGFDTWDLFSGQLDQLFLQNLEDDELLYLESCLDRKTAIMHAVSLGNKIQIDVNAFGKSLIVALCHEYQQNQADLSTFGKKAYAVWGLLPCEIAQLEPFHTLIYADEPLSWGDEKQSRKLYQAAFHYYDEF